MQGCIGFPASKLNRSSNNITEPSKNIHLGMVFPGRLIIDLHEDMFSRKMVLFPTATKYGARASWKKNTKPPIYPLHPQLCTEPRRNEFPRVTQPSQSIPCTLPPTMFFDLALPLYHLPSLFTPNTLPI